MKLTYALSLYHMKELLLQYIQAEGLTKHSASLICTDRSYT